MSEELEKGTYKARPTTQFKITSPKPRDIISTCFRDRVYQRSLNDNALYPIMTKQLIRDNWACQKGKGTDDARDRMKNISAKDVPEIWHRFLWFTMRHSWILPEYEA